MTCPQAAETAGQAAPPLFRITAITFDDSEAVQAVTALADGACLDFIRAESPLAPASGGRPATVTLPVAELLRLYGTAGEITGLDPRHAGSIPVWDSLNWVYCSLIDG
jgi:hypothetical protein